MISLIGVAMTDKVWRDHTVPFRQTIEQVMVKERPSWDSMHHDHGWPVSNIRIRYVYGLMRTCIDRNSLLSSDEFLKSHSNLFINN